MATQTQEDLNGKNIILIDENKNDLKDKNVNVEPKESKVSEFDTLDEPISETLKRDVINMYNKLQYVLIPRTSADRNKNLRNWDLWGPLVLCVILSIILSFGSSASENSKGVVFVIIFVIVWFGGLIVTLNSQFLGAKISLFQSICILGYCLFPIDVAALFIKIFSFLPILLKILMASAAFVWSSFSSVGFMSQITPPSKKILAAYPIWLFYLFLSWVILV